MTTPRNAPAKKATLPAALEEERVAVAYQAPRVLIALVGCGGTGGWVAPQLARQTWRFNQLWNRALPQARSARLLLIDFDLVEAKNIESGQNFCPPEIGHPKAQVLLNRLQLAFGMRPDEISAVVAPFSPQVLPYFTEETLTLLVGCVDNGEARNAFARYVELQQGHPFPSRTWWIDAGNEADFGQVLVGNTADEQALAGAFIHSPCLMLPSPALLAPALLGPGIGEQAQDGEQAIHAFACGEVRDEEARRPTTINFHMAGLVASYVDQLLHGGVHTFATYTRLSTMETYSARISALAIARALGHADAETFARVLCPIKEMQKLSGRAKKRV